MFTDGDTTNETEAPQTVSAPNPLIDRVYFKFSMPNGMKRQLLLAFKDDATMGVDYGLDARMLSQELTDASWMIDDNNYVIQTISNSTLNIDLPIANTTE